MKTEIFSLRKFNKSGQINNLFVNFVVISIVVPFLHIKIPAMKYLYSFFILCLSINSLFAQRNYVEITHYLFPDFVRGDVYMKNSLKSSSVLNYNLITEEMIFKDRERVLAIGKDETNLVDSIIIDGRKFVVLNSKFVEQIYSNGTEVFAEYKCSVIPPGKPAAYGGTTHTSATDTYSSFYAGGMFYELKLPDGYKTKPYTHYHFRDSNNVTSRVINMRGLTRYYRNNSTALRSYLKENSVKFENPDDIARLIEYMSNIDN